ncbi:integral peroxisomal membrane peroxin protein [Ceratobasidium sp. AG-Ba]|nr:integral peroxisomal membrane peroxin protein [Ceratobasidium sp. AG-Ba]
MSRRPTLTRDQSTLSPLPTLPSVSSEPIPEANQHLAAKRRRISLRPRALSISSAISRTSDVTKTKRRRGIDLDAETEAEPDPECVMRIESSVGDVHVADRRHSQDDESRDIYEWAILYENQRGITLFSIPYYSKLSLLPSDPPPFTIPNKPSGHGKGKTRQRETLRAPAALADYQLPDPNWRWVSKFWMVDMRGDGEVQQDGYEYNWYFRSKGWRASIGSFNSGGWVRRRRWVRLMMRPATKPANTALSAYPNSANTSISPSTSVDPTLPPSDNGDDREEETDTRIWRGDANDWTRVRGALREFRSDGRRLEAWERWLGLEERALLAHAAERLGIGMLGSKIRLDDWDVRHALDPASPVSKDSTTPGTIGIKSAPPPHDVLLPVLREHFQRILTTFIFPDSRAQFLELVRLAGFNESDVPALANFDIHSDFWSLARSSSPGSSPSKRNSTLSTR